MIEDDGQILGEESLKSSPKSILDSLEKFGKPEFVFKATRNWYWLYDALQRNDFEVTMAHLCKFCLSSTH